MADTKKVPPLYQRYSDSGVLRENRAGIQAALKPGDGATPDRATWNVDAATLHGLVPQVGDYLRGTDGVWFTVESIGELTQGAYPLACVRWKEDGL